MFGAERPSLASGCGWLHNIKKGPKGYDVHTIHLWLFHQRLGSIHRAFLIPHSKLKKLRNAAFLTPPIFSPFCIPLACGPGPGLALKRTKHQPTTRNKQPVETSESTSLTDYSSIYPDFRFQNKPDWCWPSKKRSYIEQTLFLHQQALSRAKKVKCTFYLPSYCSFNYTRILVHLTDEEKGQTKVIEFEHVWKHAKNFI